MHLSQKHESFSELFCAFLKSILNFENFQTEMPLTANVYSKIRITKNVVS